MSEANVSIVIAAFNAARTIDRALESVFRQTRRPREVIVVDDGSTDHTTERVQSWGARVTLIRQPNAGPGAARNRGIAAASSDYVGFVDADDELLPGMVEGLEDALARFPSAAAASGAHLYELKGVTTRKPRPGHVVRGDVGLLCDYFETARFHHVACVGTVLVRRHALREVRGFREDVRFGEDLDLWGRLAGLHDWVFVDTPVLVYHHSPSTSATLRIREADKPVDWLFSEARLRELVRPALWASYRRYRRDLLVQQARTALHQRATAQARQLLAAISPAPLSVEWVVTWGLARFQPAATVALKSLAVARRVRQALVERVLPPPRDGER